MKGRFSHFMEAMGVVRGRVKGEELVLEASLFTCGGGKERQVTIRHVSLYLVYQR
jgi:hypothetical protein